MSKPSEAAKADASKKGAFPEKLKSEAVALGRFAVECRSEFHKITWSKRKELIESTWVVAAVIGLLSVFVFASDQILSGILKAATGAN